MSKKLSEVELKELREAVAKVNDAHMQIGGLETQKQMLVAVSIEAEKALRETQGKLETTYGNVQINIHNGEIKENGSDS